MNRYKKLRRISMDLKQRIVALEGQVEKLQEQQESLLSIVKEHVLNKSDSKSATIKLDSSIVGPLLPSIKCDAEQYGDFSGITPEKMLEISRKYFSDFDFSSSLVE
jgi:DNA primase large subunit